MLLSISSLRERSVAFVTDSISDFLGSITGPMKIVMPPKIPGTAAGGFTRLQSLSINPFCKFLL